MSTFLFNFSNDPPPPAIKGGAESDFEILRRNPHFCCRFGIMKKLVTFIRDVFSKWLIGGTIIGQKRCILIA